MKSRHECHRRLLHNYHKFSGLPVKGKQYGGWESATIAGEGLGHYLSALALMYARTGDARWLRLAERLLVLSAPQPDGWVDLDYPDRRSPIPRSPPYRVSAGDVISAVPERRGEAPCLAGQ